MELYNHLMGGAKKRGMGVATSEEAKMAMNKYYTKKSNYRGKLLDMVYRKRPKFTLQACDEPEFLKCREENPNVDGKGNTCLDVAKKVCPSKSFGSAKYTRSKKGPHTFDIKGVDTFPKDTEIDFDEERKIVSRGLPRSKEVGKPGDTNYKKSKTNSEIARLQYADRKSKPGFIAPVMAKKKWEKNVCYKLNKNKGDKCNDNPRCKWVKSVGCVEKDLAKDKELKHAADNVLVNMIDEISSDDDEDEEEVEELETKTEGEDNKLVVTKLPKEIVMSFKNSDKITKLKNVDDNYVCYIDNDVVILIIFTIKETFEILGSLSVKDLDYEKANIDREYLEEFITLNKEDVEFISTEDDIEEADEESSEDSSGGGYVSLEEITLFGGASLDLESELSSLESNLYLFNNQTGKIYTNDGKYKYIANLVGGNVYFR